MTTEIKKEENVKPYIPLKAQDHALRMIDAGSQKRVIINKLIDKYEVSPADANSFYSEIKEEYNKAFKEQAEKDILYGALWCGGGIVLTAANIGLIFWGAIVFGGFQLIKGFVNQAKIKKKETTKLKDSTILDAE